MPASIEFSGVAVVLAGSFNPAIFQPTWFSLRELLPEGVVLDAAGSILVTPDLTTFTADWLGIQVTQQQAIFSTLDEARSADLRDLVLGVCDLLPETPVDAVGINADAHFRVESEEAWDALGDLFVPKGFWDPLFDNEMWRARSSGSRVGVRSVTMEASIDGEQAFTRIEAAPSVRITPNGVYIGINSHFQLSTGPESRANGYETRSLLADRWEPTRALEADLISRVLEAVT